MAEVSCRTVGLGAGSFRVLVWPGREPAAVFLHGLSAVAEVWIPTIEALGPGRPRCIAIDQRGHGDSPRGALDYRAGAFVQDILELIDVLGLRQPYLVGHSMGARVAMVAKARHPGVFGSTAICDIGPEQWKQNWESTVEAFTGMPRRFANKDEAVAFASQHRPLDEAGRDIFMARLREHEDGSLSWRADIEALKAIVKVQRSRNFWREWERLGDDCLLIRGGRSTELRPSVARRMQERNPRVRLIEIPDAPHNIPLAAPASLAAILQTLWTGAE